MHASSKRDLPGPSALEDEAWQMWLTAGISDVLPLPRVTTADPLAELLAYGRGIFSIVCGPTRPADEVDPVGSFTDFTAEMSVDHFMSISKAVLQDEVVKLMKQYNGFVAMDIADASTRQELEDEAKEIVDEAKEIVDEAKQLQDLLDKINQGVHDVKEKRVKDHERSKERVRSLQQTLAAILSAIKMQKKANQLEKQRWENLKMEVMEKDAFYQGCFQMASCLRRAGVDLSVEDLRKMMDTDPFAPELVRFHPQIPYSDKEIANQIKKDPLFTLPPVEEDNLRVRLQRHYNELARVAKAAKGAVAEAANGAVAEGNDIVDDDSDSNDDDDDDVMEGLKSSSSVSGKDSSVASNGDDGNDDSDKEKDDNAGSGSKAETTAPSKRKT